MYLQFSFGQKLHHQVVSSQGVSVKISNGFRVLQSVGQVNSVTGNYKTGNLMIGQGYIQSLGTVEKIIPIQNAISMIVYPNPILDSVTFKFSSDIGASATLYLFDSRGRLIYHQLGEPQQNILKYDISQIAEGVYFAKIETKNYIFTTKIIKIK